MKRIILPFLFLLCMNLIVYSKIQNITTFDRNLAKESISSNSNSSGTYKKTVKKNNTESRSKKYKKFSTSEPGETASNSTSSENIQPESTLYLSESRVNTNFSTDSTNNSTQDNKQITGFNFKNYHFELSTFIGSGHVPQNTPYVYQWLDDPTHYLFERVSMAGEAVWSINIGDQVTIEGNTYTVFKIENGMNNDSNLYDHIKAQNAVVTWQTCDTSTNNSTLSIWYAH
ncbi:MAG: hypothetical protein ACLRPU_00380 [Enterococcus hulanensis]